MSARDAAHAPSLALVMPAYQAAHLLPVSLGAFRALAPDVEAIVVDPASTDDTSRVAEELGARVVRLDERAGPAGARNAGVAETEADVILFVDADCVIHAGVPERVRAAFAEDPQLVALTGSYDDEPEARNFASLYMNLRHHWVHQGARREGASFWAGLGAVRRAAFLEAGGFDAERYPRPMIEDIELGLRLKQLGATRLDPALHVKHLKRWSVASVIRTDVFCRALPWSRLILASGQMPDDLNLKKSARVAAALAPLALLGLVAALPVGWVFGWPFALLALLPLALATFFHAGLLRFFARRSGFAFAVPAMIFHQFHLTYSALAFAWCALQHKLRPAGEVRPA